MRRSHGRSAWPPRRTRPNRPPKAFPCGEATRGRDGETRLPSLATTRPTTTTTFARAWLVWRRSSPTERVRVDGALRRSRRARAPLGPRPPDRPPPRERHLEPFVRCRRACERCLGEPRVH